MVIARFDRCDFTRDQDRAQRSAVEVELFDGAFSTVRLLTRSAAELAKASDGEDVRIVAEISGRPNGARRGVLQGLLAEPAASVDRAVVVSNKRAPTIKIA